MAKVAFLIIFILVSSTYFLKVENEYIHNHLVCLFTSQQIEQTTQNHIIKIKNSLPQNFPTNRFEFLLQKQLAQFKPEHSISCDQSKKTDYENTVLYSVRPYLYPIFPDIFKTFNSISKSLHNERIYLHNIGAFKKIIFAERESFEKFVQDCSRIKEMADQIKLLEKHLKIDKYSREPTQFADKIVEKKNAELRMNRSIRKQIGFAKKHLSTNEKLFTHKWKMYFEFEPESTLCPR